MADIPSSDILHDMKQTQKDSTHQETLHHDDASNADSNEKSGKDIEKTASHGAGYELSHLPVDEHGEYIVTMKTWAVVVVLAASYGISFWPVPFFSQIQSEMAVSFGSSAAQGAWITSVYTAGGTIAFMVCGANSDLFGRRYFILFGNILVFVGCVVGATSHTIGQSITAHTMIGFGAGNCQLAAFALPELLPNKWRHFAVVIADGLIYLDVIVGPVASRVAYANESWRWGYWVPAICIGITFVILTLFYHPPKHPRGIPWGEAARHLDYVGIVSFTAAAAMILSGIVYVQLLPSNSPTVIGLLVAGFVCLIFFGVWETVMDLKEPLAPTRLFTAHKGRALTAPFIVGFVVTMFYYGVNITWPTMLAVYFTTPQTPTHVVYSLATVQGFGIFTGAMILSFGGKYFQHWKWQMGIPITGMTFFGGLLAYITPEREALGIAFSFLTAMFYGYAQYLSIAYIQFGADQVELGIAGGLAGVARYAGGAVAVTMYSSILFSVQKSYAVKHVIAAAEAAGASPKTAEAVLAALPLGATALEKVQGLTTAIATAAGGAFVESYVQGVKVVALSSIAFGVLAIVACCFLEDIGPKMTPRIERQLLTIAILPILTMKQEIYLENDIQAEKNKYH